MTGNIFILQGLENWRPAQLRPNYLKKFSSQCRRRALAEHGLRYLCIGKIEEPTRERAKQSNIGNCYGRNAVHRPPCSRVTGGTDGRQSSRPIVNEGGRNTDGRCCRGNRALISHAEGGSMNKETDTTSGQSGIAHQKRMATLKIQDGKARKNDVGWEVRTVCKNTWAVAFSRGMEQGARCKRLTGR